MRLSLAPSLRLLWLASSSLLSATGAVPDNDLCSNPVALTSTKSDDAVALETTLVVGTNINATAESLACASSTGPTVWYSIVGTGARFRATTCMADTNFQATLVVLDDGNNCDGSSCLVYDWGDQTCPDGTMGATVEWFTLSGTTYNLAVTGYSASDTGTFGLNVVEDVLPINDDCVSAIEVFPTLTMDTTVVGSNANANWEGLSCASTTGGTVWYSVTGTGARFLASTCTPETTFAATLVLINRDCDGAGDVCLDYQWGDSNSCDDGTIGAQMEWFTENGKEYLVAVAGYSQSDSGAFGLTVMEHVLPENDVCGSAEDVSSGGLFLGSTINATLEDIACSSSTGPTVWYSLVGTGARFRVSTCTKETTFDTTLVVSQRDCDSVGASCVAYEWGDASQCKDGNIGATLEFFPDSNVVYKVAVAGYSSGDLGSFGLDVLEYILPPNDRCSEATSLEAGSDGESVFVLGSTANATLETLECSYLGEVPMLWYSIVGTGSRMRASTCSMDTLGPNTIVVSERECDTVGISCVSTTDVDCSGSNVGSAVEWDSTEGSTYKIAVATSDDPAFSLQVGLATEAFDDAVNGDVLDEDLSSVAVKSLNLFLLTKVFAVLVLIV